MFNYFLNYILSKFKQDQELPKIIEGHQHFVWFDRKKRLDQINLLTEEYQPDPGFNWRGIVWILTFIALITVPIYCGIAFKHAILLKEKRLDDLRSILDSSGGFSGHIQDLDMLIKSINQKENQISALNTGRDRWSKSLIQINSVLSPQCYLQEIRAEKTGVRLIGVGRSYYDLARFMEAIEKQQLFIRLDVNNSGLNQTKSEVNFELFCLWPEIKEDS